MTNLRFVAVTVVLAVTSLCPVISQAHPRENQYVNGVNRLPARATSYSYASEADALTYDRENARMASLNGVWKFHFAEDVDKAPENFFEKGYDVSAWNDLEVPCCWEMTLSVEAISRHPPVNGRRSKTCALVTRMPTKARP